MKPYTYRGLQVGCQTAKCKCTDKLNKQCSRAECMDVVVITFFENVGRCMCVCVCVNKQCSRAECMDVIVINVGRCMCV